MKILLLTQYFPPEPGAPQARCSEHAALWAEQGHQVQVCTGMPNYPTGIIPQAYRGKLFLREEKDGYTILRSWIHAAPNRSIVSRVTASVSFLASAFVVGLLRCRRPDVIVASSGPFFVGPLGYLLSVFKRAPLVLEVRDLLPQQAVDVGMIRNRALIRLLTAIEEFLYRHARAVVAVAEASRRRIIERGFDAGKCFTIENGIQESLFKPGERDNAIRQEWGWGDDFVAMYIGTHGVSQGLFTLVEAAECLRENSRIHLVFVGEGADKPGLMAKADALGLTNVQFVPAQPKERMPLFYAAADACLVPLKRGPYFRINIPSKIFEIMACARPIILGAEGQALEIVQAAGGGLGVPPEDPAALAQAIERLSGDVELGRQLGARGRQYVMKHFTRRQKALDYLDILTGVLEGV